MIIKKLVGIIHRKFNKDPLFKAGGDGDICHVCGLEMKSNENMTTVGGGEKMHSSCWGMFFEARIEEIKRRHLTGDKK